MIKIIMIVLIFNLINSQNNIPKTKCEKNSDCSKFNICQNNTCKQKFVFPLEFLEFLGLILLIVLYIPGLLGEISIGIIFIPLALLLLYMNNKNSIAFSNFLILINGLVRYFFNLFKYDPIKKHKTIIDYDVILIFAPTLLIGSFLGTLLKPILSNLILIILYNIFIILNMVSIIINIIKNYKLEKNNKNIIKLKKNKIRIYIKNNVIIKKIKKIENQNFHKIKFTLIILSLIFTIFITILNENSNNTNIIGFTKCSIYIWILIFIYLIIMLLILIFSIVHVIKFNKLKKDNNFIFEQELKFNKYKILKIVIFSFFFGFFSSLSFGTVILIKPFFIYLKHSTYLISTLSISIILLSKLVSLAGNIINGYIIWDYFIFFGSFILIQSIILELNKNNLIKKIKRKSILGIIFLLIIFISFSLIIIYIFIFFNPKRLLIFNPYC